MEQRKNGKELLRMGQGKEEEEVFKVVWKRNLIPSGIENAAESRVEAYHSHPFHEMLLILSDRFTALTPGGRYTHNGSCLLLYKADRLHAQINGSGIYERFYFHFSKEELKAYPPVEEMLRKTEKEDLILLPLSVRAAGQLADIARILMELTGAFAGGASAGEAENTKALIRERKELLVKYFLCEIAFRWQQKKILFSRPEAEYLPKMTAYIAGHLAWKLTIESLCDRFGIGRTKLTSDFRTFLGMSVGQYITLQRINLARELLCSGESVEQTAESCGFADSGYFIRVFRKYEQITPLQYRFLHGNTR